MAFDVEEKPAAKINMRKYAGNDERQSKALRRGSETGQFPPPPPTPPPSTNRQESHVMCSKRRRTVITTQAAGQLHGQHQQSLRLSAVRAQNRMSPQPGGCRETPGSGDRAGRVPRMHRGQKPGAGVKAKESERVGIGRESTVSLSTVAAVSGL